MAQRRNNRSSKGKRRGRLPLRSLAIALIGVTVLQYVVRGEVTWPADAYNAISKEISEYTGSPSAGWRQAGKQLEKLGKKREGEATPHFDLSGKVVKVMDGDTLSLLDTNNTQYKIRLFGIDTPEWDQPHGNTSKRALAKLVDRRQVGVVKVATDTFGRTVGTVYLEERNINLAMVEAGHAWWFARYAPYERHLAAAEEQARRQRIGLWAAAEPMPPWTWRQRHR